jgi:flagellar biogenesis protein FliO
VWVVAGAVVLIILELVITGTLTDEFGRLYSKMLELIAIHLFPGWMFNPISQNLSEKLAEYWSLELLLSVLLGSTLIALAIRFNRVDE